MIGIEIKEHNILTVLQEDLRRDIEFSVNQSDSVNKDYVNNKASFIYQNKHYDNVTYIISTTNIDQIQFAGRYLIQKFAKKALNNIVSFRQLITIRQYGPNYIISFRAVILDPEVL